MEKISYQAIFLDQESVKRVLEMQGEKLVKMPKYMHCTFKYNPSDEEIKKFTRLLLGKKVTLKVVGYCSDGKNSGFEVTLGPELEEVYTNSHTVKENGISRIRRTTPHITVSMSEDAKAVDTGLLDFKPIKEPFEVSGIGGFFIKDKTTKLQRVAYEYKDKKPPEEQTHSENIPEK